MYQKMVICQRLDAKKKVKFSPDAMKKFQSNNLLMLLDVELKVDKVRVIWKVQELKRMFNSWSSVFLKIPHQLR